MAFDFVIPAVAIDLGMLKDTLADLRGQAVQEVVVDIMDGAFAPGFALGTPMVEAVCEHGEGLRCHVHLMAHEPDRRIEALAAAGAHAITVHAEACTHLHRTTERIRALGAAPGVALRPATPLTLLEYVLPEVDTAVLMVDEPGTMPRQPQRGCFERVRLLRGAIDHRNRAMRILVRTAADAYALARFDAAGAHGAIVDRGGDLRERLDADALATLQRDMLTRRRALELA